MPTPVNPSQSQTPAIEIKPTPQTQNGFTIASDKKSATKEFVANGRNLTITVYFPENTTPEQRNIRLNTFTKESLELLGAHAIALGLGKESKKGKGKINAIAFKQDNTGQLSEAIKHFSNGSPAVSISLKHYQDKVDAITDPKNPKRAKFLAKKSTFERVQAFWQNFQNPTPATPNPKPEKNASGKNSVESSDDDDIEDVENDDESADDQLNPPSNPNNNANSAST